ncbi:hypothetical protein AYM40_07460 [Paraburkholderia phytofirmans OLGA172]|uniref:Uncharacterized protein n=1 Tax=Paraburkholderia phytofirmans OLGA172 TaxID=1417228 RepID=A0A160FIU3_9BURK|nr:hypothetical protein [Paraburkholderia phytofirmans]ANB72219.1 hypothetical protein AYM40_07460 [Paraburkholderia phytofirmans OLGA172]
MLKEVLPLDKVISFSGTRDRSDERVTVISDDAGKFEKAVQGSQLVRGRILDWVHIAMKFQAAQRSVFGSKLIAALERESVETEITHAKWLVWHGKGAARRWSGSRHWTGRLLTREGSPCRKEPLNDGSIATQCGSGSNANPRLHLHGG